MAILVGIGRPAAILPAGAVIVASGLPFRCCRSRALALAARRPAPAFSREPDPRAVCSLAGGLGLVILCGWLDPAVRAPYRPRGSSGSELAAPRARSRLSPCCSISGARRDLFVGPPVATTRDRDGFFAHSRAAGPSRRSPCPDEIAVMRDHFGLLVTPVDQVDGYMLTRGRRDAPDRGRTRRATTRRRRSPPDPLGGAGADARKVSGAGASSSRGGTGRRTGAALPPIAARVPGRPRGGGSPPQAVRSRGSSRIPSRGGRLRGRRRRRS